MGEGTYSCTKINRDTSRQTSEVKKALTSDLGLVISCVWFHHYCGSCFDQHGGKSDPMKGSDQKRWKDFVATFFFFSCDSLSTRLSQVFVLGVDLCPLPFRHHTAKEYSSLRHLHQGSRLVPGETAFRGVYCFSTNYLNLPFFQSEQRYKPDY